jgi:hypothetical protein
MTTVVVLTFGTIVPLIILRLFRMHEDSWREEGELEVLRDRPMFPRTRGTMERPEVHLLMQVLVTLIGILGGGYVVISGGYSGDIENWAAGILGLVIGYWLK